VWIALWVLLGVAGLLVVAIPAVKLFGHVRVLNREVRRVSRELRDAGEALSEAAGELSRPRR
jgi:biopolymer transport protein ExbB/TolQ